MASILLVDDERNILLLLKEVLLKLDHELTLAGNGAEALEIIEHTEFDLIILLSFSLSFLIIQTCSFFHKLLCLDALALLHRP